MLRVGLTGNVASGKSTVSRIFGELGAVVIDADQLAREAVAPGSPGLAAVAERFPATVTNGVLDRAALRNHVMADPREREALNAIIHPRVQALRAVREAEAARADAAIVVHDIPLLFEVLDPAEFDVVVLVDAPASVRKERLMKDRGLDAAQADALIAAQLPSEAKRGQATFIVDNAGPLSALRSSALRVWRELQERAGTV